MRHLRLFLALLALVLVGALGQPAYAGKAASSTPAVSSATDSTDTLDYLRPKLSPSAQQQVAQSAAPSSTAPKCCKQCTEKSQPCGNACIPKKNKCSKPKGCAC